MVRLTIFHLNFNSGHFVFSQRQYFGFDFKKYVLGVGARNGGVVEMNVAVIALLSPTIIFSLLVCEVE